ncbi:hypothetical protein COB55_03860 [Candidatus Wolfebacteria bacterium]|nr:MAG: hypothetical protein COB55_03860 [Candidatus Wolfebacteria bacterium]
MKLAITTRTHTGFTHITDLTYKSLIDYSEKCGADFVKLTKSVDNVDSDGKSHYKVLNNYDALEEYDRIVHLDSDILISKNCPNIFELVPEDKVGVVYEDKGTRIEHRKEVMENIQKTFGDIGWTQGYPNTGLIVASKQHRDIFKKINGEFYNGWGEDCALIGYNIVKYGFDVFELSFKWNHMVCFAEEWNGNPFRFDSHIVHYAGSGVFDEHLFREGDRISQIKHDVKTYGDLILGY